MRIISKHKDYYDYMVGIYGIDPLVIYDRREPEFIKFEPQGDITQINFIKKHEFHICNKKLIIFEYKNELYHKPDTLLILNKKLIKDGHGKHTLWYHNAWWYQKILINSNKNEGQLIYDHYNEKSKLNKKLRLPVILNQNGTHYLPLLKSYKFHKVIAADELYKKIYAFQSWLVDNPPIPNKQTDLEKLDSHGFDRKKSFRHRK